MMSSVTFWLLLTLVILLLLVTGFLIWRQRKQQPRAASAIVTSQLNPLTFGKAISVLYSDETVRSRYDIPCMLICSEVDAQSSGMLRSAQMEPVFVNENEESGWWHNLDGIAFELPLDGMQTKGSVGGAWRTCLDLFIKHRGRRALDGIVWVIPLSALQNTDSEYEKRLVNIGARMNEKLFDIQTRLGLQLPVYVVISACEAVSGFGKWAQALPVELQQQGLGWSNPYSLGLNYRKGWAEEALSEILQKMRQLSAELGAQQDMGDSFSQAFTLPDHLGTSLAGLPTLLQYAFRQNATLESFDLRAIHLIGQKSSAEDEAERQADPFAPVPGKGKNLPLPTFCRELFSRRIFAEFGLAHIVRRRLMYEGKHHRWIVWGTSAVAGLWLIGALISHYYAIQDAQNMIGPLTRMKNEIRNADDIADQDQTVETLRQMDEVKEWNLNSIFMPLSETNLLGVDRNILNILHQYHEKVLFKSIDNALHEKSRSLLVTQNRIQHSQNSATAAPEQMPEFLALNEFVEQTLQFEHHRDQFLNMIQKDGGNVSDLSDLLFYLFKVKLSPRGAGAAREFDAILQVSTYNTDLESKALQSSQQFTKHLTFLHDAWLNHMFYQNRVKELSDELEQKLAAFNHNKLDDIAELIKLQETIADLRTLLARSNLSWMADGTPLGENYQTMLQKIDKSELLGKPPGSIGLKNSALEAQQQFRQELEKDVTGENALLDFNEGKSLQLRADVVGLDTALGQMLHHSFAQMQATTAASYTLTEGSVIAWDAVELEAATEAYSDFQVYETTELPKAPARFQPILLRIAREQAANLIDQHMELAASNFEHVGTWRTANFDLAQKQVAPLINDLRKLNQPALATLWSKGMSQQAALLLNNIDTQLVQSTLYLPDSQAIANWDGNKQASLLAYSASVPAELQEYLSTQASLVAELDEASKPPSAWLEQNKSIPVDVPVSSINGWKKIDSELAKYAAKSPTGSMIQLEHLISENLNDLDRNNCADKLHQLIRGHETDFFQTRGQQLVRQFAKRCQVLQTDSVRIAYSAIADFYNTKLVNRYPFSATADAPPSDPILVQQFLHLLDLHLSIVVDGLNRTQQQSEALDFVNKLSTMRPLLAAMLNRDAVTGSPATLDLWPEFRINRASERGGDKIIEWKIDTDTINPAATVPNEAAGSAKAVPLYWRLGEPFVTSLRWAKDSPVGPSFDPERFPDTQVEDRKAIWRYSGEWALLSFLRDHAAAVADLDQRESSQPQAVRFDVPTRFGNGLPAGDAIVFGRLGISVHGKPERIAYSAFPTTVAPPLSSAYMQTAEAAK